MTSTTPTATPTTGGAGLDPGAIARYVDGAPPEMAQFGFFIGTWRCDVRASAPGGGEPLAMEGRWHAEWRHGGRMLVDDLQVFAPDGREILGWTNLRTWSAESGCWAISGHRALAPGSGALTHGHWRNGEMHLDFETTQDGRRLQNAVRFHAITNQSFEWVWEHRAAPNEPWTRFAAISARRVVSP